jgi:stage II sporulation protein AA (anti-sigma F factor antagonist)
MKEDVIISEFDGKVTARILADIDHHSARRMRERIDDALFEKKPRLLIIDFSAVGFMDSSGLGLILGRAEKASAMRASVQVVGLSPTLMKLVRLSGIERVSNLTVTK